MREQKRIRDYNINIGKYKTGKLNSITDVSGVTVGHYTINTNDNKTGVTAILPHGKDTFIHKCVAATHIINGYGKSAGLMQVEELRTIETPIILTNTFGVGACYHGLVEYMLNNNDLIGNFGGLTVNPVVLECNDGRLNNIRTLAIQPNHVEEAINNAQKEFLEGSVGAGTGMISYQLKGGIGTSSRIIKIGLKNYTIGTLVLANQGMKEDLLIDGFKMGKEIVKEDAVNRDLEDNGSIVILLATDIPLDSNQLKRVLKRCTVGLARTGSHLANASGDVCLGFSTTNMQNRKNIFTTSSDKTLEDRKLEKVFYAAIESVEESILNSLITADTTVGYNENKRKSLKEYIHLYK